MTQSGNGALSELTEAVRRRIPRYDHLVFAGSFGLALLVHLYMFTHKFVNHDDVGGLLNDLSFGLSSGRWLLNTVSYFSGGFSSSWINGLLGAFFLALAAVFTVKALGLRNLFSALLASLVVVAFPPAASTFSYMFCSWQYLFALACAAAGAWCVTREKLPFLAAGAVLITLGMGCYQAYFCYAAVLTLTAYAMDLCECRWEGDWKRGLFAGLKYVAALAAAMVLYFVILKICLAVTGTVLVDYQGISQMGKVTPGELLRRIASAYGHFFAFWLNRGKVFHGIILPLSVLSSLCGLGMAVYLAVKNRLYRKPLNLVLLAACLGLFPLASALIYVMTPEGIHLVMQYAMVMTLLLPALAADRVPLPSAGGVRRAAALCLAGAMLLLQGANGYECYMITNRAYFSMDMSYENAYAYSVKLLTKIELQEGYTPDTPVALMGWRHMDSVIPNTQMIGVLVGDQILNMYTYWHYLYYFLGTRLGQATEEQMDAIRETEEFQSMPVYPAAGSIQTIDGVIVVRLE